MEPGLESRDADRIVRDAKAHLDLHGLDLVQPFDIARYNDLISGNRSLEPIAMFDRPAALAVLVGNTRAIWPHFIEAFHKSAELRDCADPLDTWIEGLLQACVNQFPEECDLHFSHDAGARLVSMLHLAEASGLAHTGPAHLAVHPVHGPWFGLRGVIIVDAAPPGAPEDLTPAPCDTCEAPCVDALNQALADAPANNIASAWQSWVGIRDACPVGEGSRYSEDQIRYHYTKDRAALV